jgi:uncharacterized protein YcfL
MKKWILLPLLCLMLAACGSKKEKAELTPDQEIQVVDSATQETKARLEDLDKSVYDLQNEVDSLLNSTK